MPDHKRQHFLAQQQMRRWSMTGKSISALDNRTLKIIESVSIKNTGQQDHYYEKEPGGVENALASLEQQMSEATNRIHETEALPTLEDVDRFILMAYATTQLIRKEQLAGPFREMTRNMMQDSLEILEKEGMVPPRPPELEGIEFEVVVEDQWPRQMAVGTGMDTWPFLGDLEVMLLKSNRGRILLPDEGALRDNRLAAATNSPCGLASMGTCVMLPVSPEYCVVWFDWGVFRRTTPGKIHEMTEKEELDLGARSILHSERLTYYKEGEAGTEWCLQCAIHAGALQQAGVGWIPIPGLQTPREDDWGETQLMGVPPRPHVGKVLQRQQIQENDEEGRATPDETFRAIMMELDKLCPGKIQSLNEGR